MKKIVSLAAISALTASISLNASESNDMATIVVTAAKSEQKLSDITANSIIITSDMLEQKKNIALSDLLSQNSGISVVKTGGLGKTTDVLLRGMSNNRTLVLIDGIRYNDPSRTSGADFANLMLNDIEKIEIIKGAQSGIWGSDAAAGIINIITKKAPNGFSSSLNLEYGSYETKKAAMSVGFRDDRFDLKVSANRVESDGFSTLAPKGEDVDKYEDDGYENTTLNLKGGVNMGDGRLEAVYISIDSLSDYDSFASPDDTTMKSDADSNLNKLSYFHTLGINKFTVSKSISRFNSEEIGTTWGVKKFAGDTNSIELNNEIKYLANSAAVIGVSNEVYKVDYEEADMTTDNMDSTNNAMFATNTNMFGSIVISESLRHDDYDNFDSVTTGKLGIKYSPGNWTFGANYGTAYNAPNIMQILNPWGAANEDLDPETVKSYDLKVGYDFISVTYFSQKIENLLFWNDNGTSLDWSDDFYDNGDGTSTINGYEIEFIRPFPSLYSKAALNYTALDARNSDGETLLRRPKEQLDLNIENYSVNSLLLGVSAQYIGERYDLDDDQGAQTGKYTLINLLAKYDLNKNTDIYTKIENITDIEYQVSDGYATERRSLYLGVNAKF